MRFLQPSVLQCFLWCSLIGFLLPHTEGIACYQQDKDSSNIVVGTKGCLVSAWFEQAYGKINLTGFIYRAMTPDEPYRSKCQIMDSDNQSHHHPIDEEDLSVIENGYIECTCNTSIICATQPETFEALNSSELTFEQRKGIELIVQWMRMGLMENNAAQRPEEFIATPSTPMTTTIPTAGESTVSPSSTSIPTDTTTTASRSVTVTSTIVEEMISPIVMAISTTETTSTSATFASIRTTRAITPISTSSPTITARTKATSRTTTASLTTLAKTKATLTRKTPIIDGRNAVTTATIFNKEEHITSLSHSRLQDDFEDDKESSFNQDRILTIAAGVLCLFLFAIIIFLIIRNRKADEKSDLERRARKRRKTGSKESNAKNMSKEGSIETGLKTESGSAEKITGSKESDVQNKVTESKEQLTGSKESEVKVKTTESNETIASQEVGGPKEKSGD